MADAPGSDAGYDFAARPVPARAIAALDDGRSVLVAAPTGSGKTVVAEHAVAKALAEGGKAFYTTPIKALSNQKYADLVRRHGADRRRPAHRRQRHQRRRAGGGDDHRGAPQHDLRRRRRRSTACATSCSTRCTTSRTPTAGPVWEEVIIHLPADVRLVCLSATVSNAEELADWIATVRGPTEAVIEERRPGRAGEPLLRRRQEHARTCTCCPRSSTAGPTPRPSGSTTRRSTRAAAVAGPAAPAVLHARAGSR